VNRDLTRLAPRFRNSVKAALAECRARGLDAFVFEANRSSALQAHYYARGRTIVPPARPVTNARSNLFSWHGYGLAVDVISRSRGWNAGEEWFRRVAAIFRVHGLRWGGEWVMKDLPHFQWGKCKPSPSDRARELHAREGVRSVWRAVGAE
ncbi:MAG: M15 family metallopeptidase, partial [Vicinamibacteria bacterium]